MKSVIAEKWVTEQKAPVKEVKAQKENEFNNNTNGWEASEFLATFTPEEITEEALRINPSATESAKEYVLGALDDRPQLEAYLEQHLRFKLTPYLV